MWQTISKKSKARAFLYATVGTLLNGDLDVDFLTPSRSLEFIEYLIGYGDENMYNIDTLGYDKVIEIAQNIGYDPKKPTELNTVRKAQIQERGFRGRARYLCLPISEHL